MTAHLIAHTAACAAFVIVAIFGVRLFLMWVDRRVRAAQRRAADDCWVIVRNAPRFSATVDRFDD